MHEMKRRKSGLFFRTHYVEEKEGFLPSGDDEDGTVGLSGQEGRKERGEEESHLVTRWRQRSLRIMTLQTSMRLVV